MKHEKLQPNWTPLPRCSRCFGEMHPRARQLAGTNNIVWVMLRTHSGDVGSEPMPLEEQLFCVECGSTTEWRPAGAWVTPKNRQK